jgi:hypothetical protein
MAKLSAFSVGSVQRIWRSHKLQQHRLRTFKRSRDPSFATKLTDIVRLYIDPPAHAVVLSLDQKSQIQALDPPQPGLPIEPGRCLHKAGHDDQGAPESSEWTEPSVSNGEQ